MKHRETLGPIGTLGSKKRTLPPSSGFQRELPRKVVSYSFLSDVLASLDDGSENQECKYIISATANIHYTHNWKLFKSRILVCCLKPPKRPFNSIQNSRDISGMSDIHHQRAPRMLWWMNFRPGVVVVATVLSCTFKTFPTIPQKKQLGGFSDDVSFLECKRATTSV